ncbi:anti-sigma factor family protein [Bremerella cremea]
MTCGEALDLMPSYRAGKIPFASQRKQIEAHLAHCPRCRIAYERTA